MTTSQALMLKCNHFSGRVHQAAGVRQPEQGGAVLRPDLLGPERQPLRARGLDDGEQGRAFPLLEPLQGKHE